MAEDYIDDACGREGRFLALGKSVIHERTGLPLISGRWNLTIIWAAFGIIWAVHADDYGTHFE
jgi:hypothetical protein